MSLSDERNAGTAWPAYIVEIDLDYVTSSTSAVNDDGVGCYNTPPTSYSFTPLTVGTKTRRWITRTAPVYPTAQAIPCVEQVKIKEEKLKLGEALGNFGNVTITLRDFEDDDVGEDPFGRNVTGRYLQRLKVRNPYIQGREVRVWEGYMTDDFDLSNGEWRTYYARGWGDYRNGALTLTAAGPLQLIGLNAKECPIAVAWQLAASIDDTTDACTIKDGFWSDDDPLTGYMTIDEEYIAFTRTAGTGSCVIVRGQEGTEATAHDVDEKMQPSARWQKARVDTIMRDILVDYAGVDSALIPFTDWQTEADTWLSTYILDADVVEPTTCVDLLNELAEQCSLAMWWSALDNEIQLKAIRPPSTDSKTAIDDDAIFDDPAEKRDIAKRVSTVRMFLGLRTPVSDVTKESSYRVRYLGAPVGNGEYEHGEESIHRIFSRWFGDTDEALAGRSTFSISSQLRDGLVETQILVSKRDADIKLGGVVTLTSDELVDVDNNPITIDYWVVSRTTVKMGHDYRYTLVPSIYNARYAYLAPAGAPATYDLATAAQRDPSFYLAESNGQMANGDPGYSLA